MFESILSIMVVLAVVIGTTYLANRKGYSGLIWFFAGGWLGLATVALLPNIESPDMPVERAVHWKRIGNGLGLGIIALSVVIVLALFGSFQ